MNALILASNSSIEEAFHEAASVKKKRWHIAGKYFSTEIRSALLDLPSGSWMKRSTVECSKAIVSDRRGSSSAAEPRGCAFNSSAMRQNSSTGAFSSEQLKGGFCSGLGLGEGEGDGEGEGEGEGVSSPWEGEMGRISTSCMFNIRRVCPLRGEKVKRVEEGYVGLLTKDPLLVIARAQAWRRAAVPCFVGYEYEYEEEDQMRCAAENWAGRFQYRIHSRLFARLFVGSS